MKLKRTAPAIEWNVFVIGKSSDLFEQQVFDAIRRRAEIVSPWEPTNHKFMTKINATIRAKDLDAVDSIYRVLGNRDDVLLLL